MPQIERIPPHAEAAEKSVLGAILIDKEVFFKVSEHVKAEDFYTPAHREIYAAMAQLNAGGEPIDVITVTEALKKRKSLEAAGGRAYVSALSQEVPTTANATQYAKIVAEKAVLRRLITASGDIVEKSYSEKLDSAKVLDHAEQVIFEIAKDRQTGDVTKIQEVISNNITAIETAQKNGGQLQRRRLVRKHLLRRNVKSRKRTTGRLVLKTVNWGAALRVTAAVCLCH